VIALVTAVGCGGSVRPPADQARDGRIIAGAVEDAIQRGSAFTLQVHVVITDPTQANGDAEFRAASRSGIQKDGGSSLDYSVQVGRATGRYDIVMSGTQLFIKKHSNPRWHSLPIDQAPPLVPAARLELLRETALLAGYVNAATPQLTRSGLQREYRVQPDSARLQQLLSLNQIPPGTQASGEVDYYLSLVGKALSSVSLHMSISDPSTGQSQNVDSSIDIQAGSVSSIEAPIDATPLGPQDSLFS
jgi:hypothetical protein